MAKAEPTPTIDLSKLSKNQLIKQLQTLMRDMERSKLEGEQSRLIHDLHVHQIELVMQNQQLRETQHNLEISRDRYSQLYDFAPIGYVSLTNKGVIEQINLTGATLLGKSREKIIDLPLSAFMPSSEWSRLFSYLKQVSDAKEQIASEFRLRQDSEAYRYIYMKSVAVRDEYGKVGGCRSAIIDITERRNAEDQTRKLLQQNRDLTQRLFKSQEEERRHIARELHDEFGQWLTAIQLNTQNLTNLVGKQSPQIEACLVSIASSAAHIQKDIRDMIHSLRPTLLDELGVGDSVRELVAQWRVHNPNINCTLDLEGEFENLGETLNITLYRLVQEGLTNVTKHTGATRVAVKLCRQLDLAVSQDNIMLIIEDNGKGSDPGDSFTGFGLSGMRERVLAAGGRFSIKSSRGQGVRLEVQL
jgi:PAS domain S-box-containing protein